MRRPGRTFGLSIAIILSVMMFSLLPLMQVGMLWVVSSRLGRADLTGTGSEAAFAGAEFLDVADSTLLLQVILGVAFLIIAVFAWRGRPKGIRYVMIAALLGLTALTVGTSAAPLFSPPDLQQGLDSGDGFRRSLLIARIVVSLLVALYVLWYMNRGPARAFYRGYYLNDPPVARTENADHAKR